MKQLGMLAALLLGAACGRVEVPQPTVATAAPSVRSDIERGRSIYNYRCYFCHGYSGDAKTVAAQVLAPPPRDFTRADTARLTTEAIAHAVRHGKPGTAMKSFAGTLDAGDIEAVARFVRDEFMLRRAANTRYHTMENGWPDHERYSAAFPFARGEIALDVPAEQLDDTHRQGLRLFISACVTCHDQGKKTEETARWELRAVSYPPNASSCLSCHNRDGASLPEKPEARSPTYVARSKPHDSGDPHEIHDRPPRLSGLTAQQLEGERLYQANCAFCHAADGTGRNWIGSFIEPHPANFTDGAVMARMTRARMHQSIKDGIAGTSMPAWGNVLDPASIAAIVSYVERAFHPLAEQTSSNDWQRDKGR